ncbi:MAG: gamma-glutamyltransferase, partial [Pseudomonadota bacterium]
MKARVFPYLLLPVLVGLLGACESVPNQDVPEPEQRFFGAVASPDKFGSKVASDILKRGGNAVDAAVAVAFTLAVTYPEAGNIGGGGFMTIFHEGDAYFLDYREVAPLLATEGMYLDEKGEVIKNLSLIGHKAAGVPGTVAGLWEAHQRFGSLPWSDLV